jgi:hypothetical protein
VKKITIFVLCLIMSAPAISASWQQYNDKMMELYQQENYTEAIEYAIKALDYAKKGSDELLTLTSQNNIAKLYQLNKQFDLAEPLLVKTLAAREKKLGFKHRETMISRLNLAKLYIDMEKYLLAQDVTMKILSADIKRSAPQKTQLTNVDLLKKIHQGLDDSRQQNAASISDAKAANTKIENDLKKIAADKKAVEQKLSKLRLEFDALKTTNDTRHQAGNDDKAEMARLTAKLQAITSELQSSQQAQSSSAKEAQQYKITAEQLAVEKKSLASRLAALSKQPATPATPENMISKKSCYKLQEKALNQMTRCQEQKAQLQQDINAATKGIKRAE